MTEFDEPVLCRFLPSRALFRSLAVCWKFYRKVLLNVLPNIAVRQPTQALRRGLNFLLLPNTFAEEFRKVPVKVAVKVLVKVLSRPVRCSTKSSPCRLFSSDRMISWSARARGKVFFQEHLNYFRSFWSLWWSIMCASEFQASPPLLSSITEHYRIIMRHCHQLARLW